MSMNCKLNGMENLPLHNLHNPVRISATLVGRFIPTRIHGLIIINEFSFAPTIFMKHLKNCAHSVIDYA